MSIKSSNNYTKLLEAVGEFLGFIPPRRNKVWGEYIHRCPKCRKHPRVGLNRFAVFHISVSFCGRRMSGHTLYARLDWNEYCKREVSRTYKKMKIANVERRS